MVVATPILLLIIMMVELAFGQQLCSEVGSNCDYYTCQAMCPGWTKQMALDGTAWGGCSRSCGVDYSLHMTNRYCISRDESGSYPCPPRRCQPGTARSGVKPYGCDSCAAGFYYPELEAMAASETFPYQLTGSTAYACIACEAGKYQPSRRQTTCIECPALQAGYYQAEACGGKSGGRQEPCYTCPAGARVTTACTATSNTVCTTYQCKAGEYIAAAGVYSCTKCGAGFYMPTAGTNYACRECDYYKGEYQDEEGQTSCKTCPSLIQGSYWGKSCGFNKAGEMVTCTTCKAGYQKVTPCNDALDTFCEDFKCAPGTYQGHPGYPECTLCDAGTYQSTIGGGMWGCPGCPAGKYQPARGAVTCLECQALKANQTYWAVECQGASSGRQAACTTVCPPPYTRVVQGCSANADTVCGGFACEAGKYQPNAGVTSCTACEAGKYKNLTGPTACVACGAGQYQSSAGASVCEVCTVLRQGFYWAAACSGASGGSQELCAVSCPANQWVQKECGGGNNTVCAPLIYCSGGRITTRQGCVACPVGTYRPDPASASELAPATCTECEAGTYQPNVGRTGCFECPSLLPGVYQAERCTGAKVGRTAYCSTCLPGKTVVRACTVTEDTLCGAACAPSMANSTQVQWWITDARRCSPGEYLWGLGPPPDYGKICKACPSDMIGVDGVVCVRCPGALEMPRWPDQASCVCRPPARMMQGGGCACPPGWQPLGNGSCVACGNNSFGERGSGCSACAAGTYSAGGGATACVACGRGLYRLSGEAGGCHGCGRVGWMATDAATGGCVACNTSCAVGWTESGPCPGSAANQTLYKVCEPCEALPAHSRWVVTGGCVFECDSGYYRKGAWECAECSAEPCPRGRQWEACSRDADRKCELECANASKPLFNAKWAASTGPGDCPWECEAGYTLARSDYWVFVIYECV